MSFDMLVVRWLDCTACYHCDVTMWRLYYEELDMANRTAVVIAREIAQIKSSPFAQHLKDAAIKVLMEEAEALLAAKAAQLGLSLPRPVPPTEAPAGAPVAAGRSAKG